MTTMVATLNNSDKIKAQDDPESIATSIYNSCISSQKNVIRINFIPKKLSSKKEGETMLTTNAEIIVVIDAPMNPSQVFFGDNLIRGVFPKKKPQI